MKKARHTSTAMTRIETILAAESSRLSSSHIMNAGCGGLPCIHRTARGAAGFPAPRRERLTSWRGFR